MQKERDQRIEEEGELAISDIEIYFKIRAIEAACIGSGVKKECWNKIEPRNRQMDIQIQGSVTQQ